MTPWLYSVSALAPPPAARALAGLGAHRLRFREFLLVVVNRREEVVRVDRIGIDLQRLLQRRLGRRVVLLRGVVRPDVHVALRALGHLRDHLVELRDRLVVLAGVAQVGAFRVRRLQRFGARGGLGGLFLRRGPGVAPRLELEVHFRHVEADPRRERLLQPVLLGRDQVVPGWDADLDVVPLFLGLQRVLRPAVLVLDQDGGPLDRLLLRVGDLALQLPRLGECRRRRQGEAQHHRADPERPAEIVAAHHRNLHR